MGRRAILATALLLGALPALSCGDEDFEAADEVVARVEGEAADSEATSSQKPSGNESAPRVVFLGTSLTAGYALAEAEAYPARVGELLAARGVAVEVVNAGVSGDTSAGGLARLDWLLRQQPDVMVVELGANDGLRGLPPEVTEANLRSIVEQSTAAGARVILVGMKVPPNYGEEYARRFEAVFQDLAGQLGVELVPFLLSGVAGLPELNLADGIHPNAEGHALIAQTMAPYVEAAVAALR